LELTPIPLRDRIEQVAVQARAAGASRLKILPLFLSAGVHVTEDIPSEVAWAQKALRERVRLELQPHVGTYPELAQLLAQRLAQVPTEASILLAHGSRRSGANQAITALAGGLKALPAYWSVEPSLAGQVEVLAGSGKQAIAIVPYFLFSGGITDAIARQIHQLQQKFPHVAFKLAEPLGATPEFAHLLVKRMER
jgi:sirohydrochlorin ferrochelatase